MKKFSFVLAAFLAVSTAVTIQAEDLFPETAQETSGNSGEVASGDEMVTPEDVVEEGMVPIYGTSVKDGVYDVTVESSSSMFKIVSCELTVKEGGMTAVLTMSSDGYLKLFMGTGEEAAKAEEDDCIPFVEDENGAQTYEVPVEALDMGIDCAAYSRRKEKWYDRVLLFRADSLPQDAFTGGMITAPEDLALEDGTYMVDVVLEGGSGKTSVESPAEMTVKDGAVTATIIFSSPHYDYVLVDGEKLLMTNEEGENSTFEIPVTGFDWKLPIVGDTLAMGNPHEIEYTLTFDSESIEKAEGQTGGEAAFEETETISEEAETTLTSADGSSTVTMEAEANGPPSLSGLEYESRVELQFAECFDVYHYSGGYTLLDIHDDRRYLLIPEDGEVPEGLDSDIVILHRPLDRIYLAATAAMSLFDAIDSIDAIRLSGTDAGGWYIDHAVEAMENGDMLFAGKYNEPDYELLMDEGCDVAIESTMILHSPRVQEMIEEMGIPVLIDRSSYETHPLGRTEWVKLYGALMDRDEEAAAFFDGQAKIITELKDFQNTEKTVAFFYVSTDGSAVVRKASDYIPRMIEIAGGRYVPDDSADGESGQSSVPMTMEEFYAAAVDADYLIYNATIDDPIASLDDLFAKSGLFRDFKAVNEGNVWCAGKYLYQATDIVGNMISDIHIMLTGGDESSMTFLSRIS